MPDSCDPGQGPALRIDRSKAEGKSKAKMRRRTSLLFMMSILFRNKMMFVLESNLFDTIVVQRLTESACQEKQMSTHSGPSDGDARDG